MSNSTKTLQNVVDDSRNIADLSPIFDLAGWSVENALQIANEVMKDIVAERFNWKWNRLRLAPFYTNSWQQDYPQIGVTNLGWIEHAYIIDINNTSIPKPLFWLRAVKDLERTAQVTAKPSELCWHYNSQLDEISENAWVPNTVITNPLGQVAQPSNPPLCFIDVNGNILTVTTFGKTGAGPAAPFAAANAPEGTPVVDNTVTWTVAGPNSQGFRIAAKPSQTGVVYKVNPIGQAKIILFTTMQQTLAPIPDDFSAYFFEGFRSKLYPRSPIARVRSEATKTHLAWLESLQQAKGQGDHEPDSFGIVPVRSIMDSDIPAEPGPSWPWGPLAR